MGTEGEPEENPEVKSCQVFCSCMIPTMDLAFAFPLHSIQNASALLRTLPRMILDQIALYVTTYSSITYLRCIVLKLLRKCLENVLTTSRKVRRTRSPSRNMSPGDQSIISKVVLVRRSSHLRD